MTDRPAALRVVIEINPPDAELRNWCRDHGVEYRPIFTEQETCDETETDKVT